MDDITKYKKYILQLQRQLTEYERKLKREKHQNKVLQRQVDQLQRRGQ